jgi:hypothetical protein
VNENGVEVSVFRKFIDEPWENITGLTAEGPGEVQTRFTATGLVLLGPLGLAQSKRRGKPPRCELLRLLRFWSLAE